jgi:hypothetical protein
MRFVATDLGTKRRENPNTGQPFRKGNPKDAGSQQWLNKLDQRPENRQLNASRRIKIETVPAENNHGGDQNRQAESALGLA